MDSTGIVYKKTIGQYIVRSGDRLVACSLSSKLHKQLGMAAPEEDRRGKRPVKRLDNMDPIAIGDQVRYVTAPGNSQTGMILEVLPRRTWLSRRSAVPMPSARPFEQIIVANVDQVVPVFSAAEPAPKWNMLDRYLVSAEAAGLPALICITKLDLVQSEAGETEAEIANEVSDYRRAGYPVLLVSAYNGQGLDELRTALAGRVSVLLGKSGVGKTSLLNALEPGLGLRVNAVSQVTGKGKHTTTHFEMFPLNLNGSGSHQDAAIRPGAAIVDTPGVREFGLWDVDATDLAHYFPEMRPFLGRCRFGLGCRHDEEPGCAIRKAVMAGEISPRRYQSYLRLRVDG